MSEYKILDEPYINYNKSWNVIYTSCSNFISVFKNKDYYIQLNYSNLVRYYIFEFLHIYKGKNETILELIYFLKLDKTNKKLQILKSIIESESTFRIIKKYYPEKGVFDLNSVNMNLLNHIYFHKEKIFNEENILNLIKKQIKLIAISTDDEFLTIMNTKNIITGFKANPSTIQDQKYGIDYYLVKGDTNLSLKLITLTEKSEYELVNHCGVIKIIINDIKSDINNFKIGINAMRYQFLVIKTNSELVFINTKSIIEINNRKLDKNLSITFDMTMISDVNKTSTYIKKFSII